MKILLADPHVEVRAALRLVFEQQPDIRVVGEASDAIELFSLVTKECPDVVLLDPDLPETQMIRRVRRSPLAELIEVLRKLCPAIRIINLSTQPNAEKECMLAKADAFFCKSDPPDALLALLQQMLPDTSEKNTSKTWLQNTILPHPIEK